MVWRSLDFHAPSIYVHSVPSQPLVGQFSLLSVLLLITHLVLLINTLDVCDLASQERHHAAQAR